ncbi:S ribonuclease [Pyrus ussuriensis x Pyrus communis]|uniref:S ribonuclease n=1 Tax=Pyrus ussuriensis x Pyrus communis TaxID=2448454 RepID=A0A5N5F391_9ROSA|nr:S ribonuclease [Pyrus ussuriensis x Pyrus communis]
MKLQSLKMKNYLHQRPKPAILNNFNSNEECTCKLNLCVITKEESLILDLINRLEDPLEKHHMDENFGNDNKDNCYEISPPIRPKK